MNGTELRQFQRQPIALRLRLATAGEETDTFTDGVSRGGFSTRLVVLPSLGETLAVVIYLPDGTPLKGEAQCRNLRPGNIVGFQLTFGQEQNVIWDAFVDQEEATGSLWRMLNRYAQAHQEDDGHLGSVVSRGRLEAMIQPRGQGSDQLAGFFSRNQEQVAVRLHTVGENGEAYSIAFEKHPSSVAAICDLATRLPGFREVADRAVNRVLDDKLLVRLNDRTPVIPVRICELSRGGYAYVQSDDDGKVGLVSLVLGELILVEVDGQRMFPFFDDEELERIACDTVRHDIERPVFRSIAAEGQNPELSGQAEKPASGSQPVPTEGVHAVRFAMARAEQVQSRAYGERTMRLFPELWVRARDRDNFEVMGPAMEDGPRICLLALVGHRAPRVVRLLEESDVTLMRKPG